MPDNTFTREPPNDRLLAAAITAIGKSTVGPAQRTWFENWFLTLNLDVLKRLPELEADDVTFRQVMRKVLAHTEAGCDLWRLRGPFEPEIARAKYIRHNIEKMDAGTRKNMETLNDPGIRAQVERIEADDIKFLLENSDDYRKEPLRKVVIEPLLAMLRDEGIISEEMIAPRELPLTRMVEACLDYLGIDQARRPTKLTASINYIKSLAKRPARHPTD